MKNIYFFTLVLFGFNLSVSQNIDSSVSQIANINPGDANGVPGNFIEFNGEIFFRANDGVNGIELWKIDSNLNVTLVQDIRPGSGNGSPQNFFIYNSKLYFSAFDQNVGGNDLFSTDGTTVTSEALYDTNFSAPSDFFEYNGKLYLRGFNANFQFGRLIEYDGTNAVEVPDVGPGEESYFGDHFVLNDKFLLNMNYSTDDATTGNELYAYDPAAQTFTLIKDINAGPGNSGISNFVQLGNEVYFEAMNNVWKTDGTTSGTVEVSSIANQNITNVGNFFVWNGELYFEGDNGGGVSNDELWKYNPNTDLVTQISNTSGNNDDHDPSDFVVVNSPLLPMEILAYSGEPGADDDSRLFSTNGIMTFQLTDQFIDVSEIFYWPAQELVLFRAEELDANGDDIDGLELYAYDLNTLSTDNQTLDNVVIYPNPVKNTIFVQSSSNFDEYSIYNLQGQSVQKGTLQSKTIETNLSSGVYILNLSSAGRVTQKKIIIQ